MTSRKTIPQILGPDPGKAFQNVIYRHRHYMRMYL